MSHATQAVRDISCPSAWLPLSRWNQGVKQQHQTGDGITAGPLHVWPDCLSHRMDCIFCKNTHCLPLSCSPSEAHLSGRMDCTSSSTGLGSAPWSTQ